MSSHKGLTYTWVAIISTCLAYGCINIVQNALPLLVGATAAGLSLTASQVGLAFTLDGLAMGVVAFAMAPLVSRLPKLVSLWGAFAVIAVMHLAMAWADGAGQVMVIRLTAGAATGLALVALNNIVAVSSDPVRFYAGATASAILFGILSFLVLPPLVESYGIAGAFWPLVAMMLAVMPLLMFLPRLSHSEAATPAARDHTGSSARLKMAFIATVLSVQGAQVAYYAFVERRADHIGIDPVSIGETLGLSYSLALVALLLVSWLGDRVGQMRALVACLSTQMVCAAVVYMSDAPALVTVAILVQSPLYLASIPYQLGIGAAMDETGRLSNFAIGAFFIGVGLGPLIGGVLIDGFGYTSIAVINVMVMTGALAIYGLATRRIKQMAG